MMPPLALDPIQPDEQDSANARPALKQIEKFLANHPEETEPVRVRVEDPERQDSATDLVLPRGAVDLLARILTHMAAGEAVSVVPMHAELTTQQAADLLNVSRPFLVGLLDSGEIEYRMVGSHRRVTAASVVDYRQKDDRRRRTKADELAALTQEMGLH